MSQKGIAGWLLTPLFGVPFIIIAILLIFFLVFFFGVAFLFKNIVWLAIVIGGLFIAYQMAKTKKLDVRGFIAFVVVILFVWLLGGIFGLLAVGVQNRNVEISISSTLESELGFQPLSLAYGYDEQVLSESRFSFTCMSPLAETIGCRLAPSTYRPIEITIKNKDPELPLPPTLIVLTVDTSPLRLNQEVNLNQLKAEGKVERGDVFLVNTRDRAVWDGVVDWILRRGPLSPAHGSKVVFLVMDTTLKAGESITLGKGDDGKPYLFLVADRGAKINEGHVLQVALLEFTPEDKYRYGHCQGILGCIWHGINKVGVLIWDALCGIFGCTEMRTIFAVSGYKFLVAYPYVEILLVLGIIGVVAVAITKLIGLW